MSNNIGKTLSIIQSLEENEQYEKAVEELLKLNEAVPDNIEIVKNLAMDYEVLKNADEAIFWWEKYKSLDANDTISYFQLVDLYADKDKFQYYMNRAHIKVIEGKNGQAADDFKKAINNSKDEAETSKARFMLAVMYESMQKNTEAIQEYLRLLEYEDNLNIYQRLVELYKLESDEDAIGLLEDAIEKFPNENELKEEIAKLYYKIGDFEKTLKYAQNDLTKAKVYLEKQDNEKAFEILSNAKISEENAIRYHSLWAEYNYNLSEYDKALENLSNLEKVSPNSPVLYQMRALIYEAQNNEYIAHLCWAKCYELKGQVDLTIDELLLAHQANPQDERAILSLINVYTHQNDNHSVIEFCEKLHKIDDKNTFALKKLAEFYQNHGENEMALDFYEKLYVVDKSNVANLKLLAVAYEKARDIDNATKAWQKYLEKAPMSEDTEQIKRKLEVLEKSEASVVSSEGFLEKLIGFFSGK
ncbi:hypothetical protein IJE86_09260 [bacterium]|nr:hypothetical protein [bacterium]